MAKRSLHGIRGILTGASSGIGRALASQLVARGVRLVLVARREQQLNELAKELQSSPGSVELVVGDISDRDVRQQALERAIASFGGLDLLINNAGIGAIGRFETATEDRLRRIMEVNFFATAEMIRLALPQLKTGRKPLVVNVSSILGHRGVPHSAEYCASKFAVQGLSESLRAEFARLGIDLLVVSPGTTQTEFFQHASQRAQTPWPQQPGMKPAVVARHTLRAIKSGRHEIVINPRGKLLVWANRLAPGLVDRFLERYG